MTPSELRNLAARFAAAGMVAPSPLIRSGGKAKDGTHEPFGVVADLVVDLADALNHAAQNGLSALDIYADTVRAPPADDLRVNGLLQRVTVLARRIVAADGATLRILHDGDGALRAVRIFSPTIEGAFALHGGPDGELGYDLSKMADDFGPPHFTNFGWRDGAIAVGTTAVPPGLLLYGEPLHRVLTNLFALSAAIAGNASATDAELTLCHDALTWIMRWSGVKTEFGELIRGAEALRALLPVPQRGKRPARPLPSLSTQHYIALGDAQLTLMSALEDTMRSLQASSDISQLVGNVVTTYGGRDDDDLRTLDLRCKELAGQLEAQIDALDKAARTMRQEQFEAEIASLHLKLASELAQIKAMAKLGFQLGLALITLASSIGALCVGVPPNPNAVTEQGLKGVKGLKSLFEDAIFLGQNVQGPLDALILLANNFVAPFEWAVHNAGVLQKFADPAKSILNAALPVLHGPLRGLDVTAQAEQLGSAMRVLASMPDALEAKAAWSVLEVDIVNRLDLVLQDSESDSEVKKAAAEFKTRVQRVVIYGRLLAEQSAAKGAIARELGGVKLEALGMVAKRQRLENLNKDLSNKAASLDQLRAETALRKEGAARAFFVAGFGARASQRYATGRAPTATLKIPANLEQMAEALAALKTEYANAEAAAHKDEASFDREIRITDAPLLELLSARRSVHFAIPLDHEALNFKRIRLTSVQAWLETAEAGTAPVAIDLVTGSEFEDRDDGGTEHYLGSPRAVRFEYRGMKVEVEQALDKVGLPPFTTWVAEVVAPSKLTGPVLALRLVMRGRITVR